MKSLMSVQGLSSDADLMWSRFEATFFTEVSGCIFIHHREDALARCPLHESAKKCPLPSFDHARYTVDVQEIRTTENLES